MAVTASPVGDDRKKDRDVWLGCSADRSPASSAVRERSWLGTWSRTRRMRLVHLGQKVEEKTAIEPRVIQIRAEETRPVTWFTTS